MRQRGKSVWKPGSLMAGALESLDQSQATFISFGTTLADHRRRRVVVHEHVAIRNDGAQPGATASRIRSEDINSDC
jgi:hypothetical protein